MKIESNRSILRDVIDFLHKNIIVVIVCFVLFPKHSSITSFL